MAEIELVRLTPEVTEEAYALYCSVKGQPGCTWNDHYPDHDLITEDIALGEAYGIFDEGRLIAAIARDRDELVDSLPVWQGGQPGAELCRAVVSQDYQGQGIVGKMALAMMDKLRERGFISAHYLVSPGNEKALKAYVCLGFERVGECDLYDQHWWCYEKIL